MNYNQSTTRILLFLSLVYTVANVVLQSTNVENELQSFNAPFHWSASPSTIDSLNTTGSWFPLKGTVIQFRLPKEPTGKSWRIFIQYTVRATIESSINTTNGVRFLQPRTSEVTKDYIGARVTLDGQAYRLGGSLGIAESGNNFAEIKGALVIDILEGQHSVSLQWKKWGKVSLQSSSNKWISTSRWISAFSESSFIDAVQPLKEAKLISKNWTFVTGMTLNFEHPFDRKIHKRFPTMITSPVLAFYRMQVRADSTDLKTVSSVSARILLDETPLEESVSNFALVLNAKSPSPSTLGQVSGTARLPKSALVGKHTLFVQWRIIGESNCTWSSSPSFLDGWIESRILTIASEKEGFGLQCATTHKPGGFLCDEISSKQPSPFQWWSVENSKIVCKVDDDADSFGAFVQVSISFSHSRFCIGNASSNLVNFNAEQLSISLIVDGVARGETLSISDETQIRAIRLAPGDHSMYIQWRLEMPESVESSLLASELSRCASGSLSYTLAPPLNRAPVVILRDIQDLIFVEHDDEIDGLSESGGTWKLQGVEDVPFEIRGLFVADEDSSLESSMPISILLSTFFGTLSVDNISLYEDVTLNRTISEDGNLRILSMQGSIDSVNGVINSLKYIPDANFNGVDTLTINVSDLGYVGLGGALKDSVYITIVVEAVNDAPVIVFPLEELTCREDESLSIESLSISDIDADTPMLFISEANDDYDYSQNGGIDVSLSVLHGSILFRGNISKVRIFGQDSLNSSFIRLCGHVQSVNEVLKTLVYYPHLHSNFMTVRDTLLIIVQDHGRFGSGGALQTSKNVNIKVFPVNDKPTFTFPLIRRLKLPGIRIVIPNTRNVQQHRITVSVMSPLAGLVYLQDSISNLINNGTFVNNNFFRFLVLEGNYSSLARSLSEITYERTRPWDGADSINLFLQDIDSDNALESNGHLIRFDLFLVFGFDQIKTFPTIIEPISPRSGPFVGGTKVVVIISNAHDNTRTKKNSTLYCSFGDIAMVPATIVKFETNRLVLECISPPIVSFHRQSSVRLFITDNSTFWSDTTSQVSEKADFTYYVDPVFYLYSETTIFLGNANTKVLLKSDTPISTAIVSNVLCRFVSQKLYISRGNITKALLSDENQVILLSDSVSCSPKWSSDFIESVGEYWASDNADECIDMTMQIAMNGVDFVSQTQSQIFLCPDAKISQVIPPFGTINGGSEISIIGSGFRINPFLFCVFTSSITQKPVFVYATFVSSSKIICTTPTLFAVTGEKESKNVESVSLQVVMTSRNIIPTTSSVEFFYVKQWVINAIVPAFGSVTGGTVISIFESGGVTDALLGNYTLNLVTLCRFGDDIIIQAQSTYSSLVQCITPTSPAFQEGSISVSVSLNNGADWSSPSSFSFVVIPILQKALYYFFDNSTISSISVIGYGFRDLPLLSCSFSSSKLTVVFLAEFISSNEIICSSDDEIDESFLTSDRMTISVSNNGFEWSLPLNITSRESNMIHNSYDVDYGSLQYTPIHHSPQIEISPTIFPLPRGEFVSFSKTNLLVQDDTNSRKMFHITPFLLSLYPSVAWVMTKSLVVTIQGVDLLDSVATSVFDCIITDDIVTVSSPLLNVSETEGICIIPSHLLSTPRILNIAITSSFAVSNTLNVVILNRTNIAYDNVFEVSTKSITQKEDQEAQLSSSALFPIKLLDDLIKVNSTSQHLITLFDLSPIVIDASLERIHEISFSLSSSLPENVIDSPWHLFCQISSNNQIITRMSIIAILGLRISCASLFSPLLCSHNNSSLNLYSSIFGEISDSIKLPIHCDSFIIKSHNSSLQSNSLSIYPLSHERVSMNIYKTIPSIVNIVFNRFIRIIGTGFVYDPFLSCTWNIYDVDIIYHEVSPAAFVSETQILCFIPTLMPLTPLQFNLSVSVMNPILNVSLSSSQLSVYFYSKMHQKDIEISPTGKNLTISQKVLHVSPLVGNTQGSTLVVLQGYGLETSRNGAFCLFGAILTQIRVLNDGLATCLSPPVSYSIALSFDVLYHNESILDSPNGIYSTFSFTSDTVEEVIDESGKKTPILTNDFATSIDDVIQILSVSVSRSSNNFMLLVHLATPIEDSSLFEHFHYDHFRDPVCIITSERVVVSFAMRVSPSLWSCEVPIVSVSLLADVYLAIRIDESNVNVSSTFSFHLSEVTRASTPSLLGIVDSPSFLNISISPTIFLASGGAVIDIKGYQISQVSLRQSFCRFHFLLLDEVVSTPLYADSSDMMQIHCNTPVVPSSISALEDMSFASFSIIDMTSGYEFFDIKYLHSSNTASIDYLSFIKESITLSVLPSAIYDSESATALVSGLFPELGNSFGIACVFQMGSNVTFSVLASRISSTRASCFAPLLPVGDATLNVANILVKCLSSTDDVSACLVPGQRFNSGVLFKYISTPRAENIVPPFVPFSGGVLLRVNGAGFSKASLSSPKLSCIFRSRDDIVLSKSPAVAVSRSTVVCESPPLHTSENVFDGSETITPIWVSLSVFEGHNSHNVGYGVPIFYYSDLEIVTRPQTLRTTSDVELVIRKGSLFRELVARSGAMPDVYCKFGKSVALLGSRSKSLEGEGVTIICPSPLAKNVTSQSSLQSVGISISIDGGYYFSQTFSEFTFLQTPEIALVFPSSSSLSVGSFVHIRGRNFANIDSLTCHFSLPHYPTRQASNLVHVSALWISEFLVVCKSPQITSSWGTGAGQISVSNDGTAKGSSNKLSFLFLTDMTVSKLSPSFGGELGGTIVSVFGTGFIDVSTLICVFSAANNTVRSTLESSLAGTYYKKIPAIFISISEVQCVTPPFDFESAFITILDESVTIVNDLINPSLESTFSFTPELKLISLTPRVCDLEGCILKVMGNFLQPYFDNDITERPHCIFTISGGFILSSPLIFPNTSAIEGGQKLTFEFATCSFPNVTEVSLLDHTVSVELSYFSQRSIRVEDRSRTSSGQKILIVRRPHVISISPMILSESENTHVYIESIGSLSISSLSCSFAIDNCSVGIRTIAGVSGGSHKQLTSCPVPRGLLPGKYIVCLTNDGIMFGNSVQVMVTLQSSTSLRIPLSTSTDVSIFGTNFRPDITSINQSSFSEICSYVSSHNSICYSERPTSLANNMSMPSAFPTSGSVYGGTKVVFRNVRLLQNFSSKIVCIFGYSNIISAVISNSNEISCISPPSLTTGPVSLHLSVFSTNDMPMQMTLVSIIFIYVPRAHALGLSSINVFEGNRGRVRVFGSEFVSSGTLHCRIGNISALADWQSPSILLCPLPLLSPGLRQTLSVSNDGSDFSGFSTTINVFPRVSVVDAYHGSPGHSSALGLLTAHISPSPGVDFGFTCLFGSKPIRAHKINLTTILCAYPFRSKYMDFSSISIISSSDHVYIADSIFNNSFSHVVRIMSVHPLTLPEFNFNSKEITQFTIRGSGFIVTPPDSMRIRLGAHSFVCETLSVIKMACSVPSNVFSFAGVSLSLSVEIVGSPIQVYYQQPISIVTRSETITVSPSVLITSEDGSFGGISHLSVTGAGFMNSSLLSCAVIPHGETSSFEITIMPAFFVSPALVLCQLPSFLPFTSNNEFNVLISSNGGQSWDDLRNTSLVRVIDRPRIESIYPRTVSTKGGVTLLIYGQNFDIPYLEKSYKTVTCRIGTETTVGIVENENLVQCVVPPLQVQTSGNLYRTVLVELSFGDDGTVTSDRSSIDYFDTSTSSLISPSFLPLSGPLNGGTRVSLLTLTNATAQCFFGVIAVNVTITENGALECVSPSFLFHLGNIDEKLPVFVSFSVISSLGLSLIEPSQFEYLPIVFIERILFDVSSTKNESVVYIFGSGFIPTVTLSCRLRTSEVSKVLPARFISSHTVVCSLPDDFFPLKSTLSVSTNGLDFSNSVNIPPRVIPHTIELIKPTQGPTSGGTLVSFLGRSLVFSPNACCVFGHSGHSPATFHSNFEVSCVSPLKNVESSLLVNLSLSYDCMKLPPSSKIFTYTSPLQVYSIEPRSGPLSGGTRITFNLSVSVDSDSTILCCFGEKECSSLSFQRL
jgi:hypothetical protein